MSTVADIDLKAICQRMKSVAQIIRLPLRSGQWSGVNGSVLGQGTGSSLDFQDQRPYVPGDDPRHINWQAYARNGSYTMKLYRQEVSPRVDLLLDVSASMFLNEAKAMRVWELAYFCVESALQLGASLKVHTVGRISREVPLDQVMAGAWGVEEAGDVRSVPPHPSPLPPGRGSFFSRLWKRDRQTMAHSIDEAAKGSQRKNFFSRKSKQDEPTIPLSPGERVGVRGEASPATHAPTHATTPLRSGSLRVLISDLLFPTAPELITTPFTANRGRGLLLAPFCAEEANPEWLGNIDFEDAETAHCEKRRVPAATLERYLLAYRRHFDLWREPCLKQGIAMARVSAEAEFVSALRAEAAKTGAVELS